MESAKRLRVYLKQNGHDPDKVKTPDMLTPRQRRRLRKKAQRNENRQAREAILDEATAWGARS